MCYTFMHVPIYVYQNNEFMMMTGLTSCSSFVSCLKLYFSSYVFVYMFLV